MFHRPEPMALRIYGNRPLKTVPGQATRPTLAKVREAVFNIWQGKISECRWLDLCAGNGTMGAEALCRGASAVIGIEQASRACSVIRENWQAVAKPEQTIRVIQGDVVKRLPQLAGQQFDCIYFDPPYASEVYNPVIRAIAQLGLLASDGELAVEHDPQRQFDNLDWGESDRLIICRHKVYGGTALTFFGKDE